MRKFVVAAAIAGGLALLPTHANAQGFGYCTARGSFGDVVSKIFPWSDDPNFSYAVEGRWEDYLRENLGFRSGNLLDCSKHDTTSEAEYWHSKLLSRLRLVDYVHPQQQARSTSTASAKPEKPKAEQTPTTNTAASGGGSSDAQPTQAEKHAAVVQRNLEKQAKYQAEMKAWQDQIDAQKAEEERKNAKFAADKQAAAEKLAVFEAEQAAHRSEMEKHAQRLLEHQDAQRLHSLCTVGDRAACDRLAGGKLAEAKLPKTDAGEASTDDDARQCVTEPVLSPNEAYKGSLKAVVTNGCAKPVDVLICLMRTGGWNCGMTVGLKPQDNWTWWTMNPQDGVFWDARTTGSKRNLDRPAGA